jgi:hypothetical protein
MRITTNTTPLTPNSHEYICAKYYLTKFEKLDIRVQRRRSEDGLTLPNFQRTLVPLAKPKRPENKFNQNHFA